jgi:hypothetical protein
VSALELTGHPEPAGHLAHKAVGPRWVPDNVGLALVQSQTADVYALRLAHTGALIAYQMRPNPDIPKDWNLITFPLDPRYTKQGTLDGKVGLEPDADYPNALSYSSDSSYFKPIEAYQLKTQVTREEQELATLFAQYQADPGAISKATAATVDQPTKRNLVNTYLWTADGGRFAETEQTLDTRSETVGGSFSFKAMAGVHAQVDLAFATANVAFEVTAKAGAHLELEVHKTKESRTSFGLDVAAGPERDITVVDSSGQRSRRPGKVDAYRFMTFYMAPRSSYHDTFFNRVVDPIWLAQSDDLAAAALRQARQPATQPACWRVFHRVTYVSRVLQSLKQQDQDGLGRVLQTLDIDSNYELIKALEPYVQGRTGSYGDLAGAVRQAVATHLPDLLPHLSEIIAFMAAYYGLPDGPAA